MNYHNLKYAQGRSLVEVMISMTIGLVIALAISTLVITNSQTYKVFDDKSVMEEDGRMALNMLAIQVRQIGYGNVMDTGHHVESGGGSTDFSDSTALTQGIRGCTGGFVTPNGDPTACNNTATTPDSIVVRYVASSDNALSVSASGVAAPLDCLGQTVPLDNTDPSNLVYTVENRYYIASNPANGRREMYCVGNGNSPLGATTFAAGQPVMENVVDMKIIYGYDQLGAQSVNGFYTAASLNDGTVPSPLNPIGKPVDVNDPPIPPWKRVVSAKICLVMRSANDNLVKTPVQYIDCSGNTVTATDKRLYSTFSSVVALRGRASGRTL